jgi:hypothetical protein
MTAKTHIKLGQTVRDVTSGFTGIAIQTLEWMNGNIQIAIQPKQKEGDVTYPEAMFLDHHLVEVIDAGVSERVTEPAECVIELGQKVQDKASLFTGIATKKATYMNGCISFGVKPQVREGALTNDNPYESWIDHTLLRVVGEGLLKDKPKVATSATTGKAPGGPASRVDNR